MSRITVLAAFILTVASGCSERRAEAKSKEMDAEAKMRAEAARKEMGQLPKTFQTPDYFKKNDNSKPVDPPAAKTKP